VKNLGIERIFRLTEKEFPEGCETRASHWNCRSLLSTFPAFVKSGRAQAAPARLNPLYSQSLAPPKNFL